MLSKEIPFLRIIVPLCLGIVWGMLVSPHIIFIISLAVISLASLLLSLIQNNRLTNNVFGIAIFISFFTCGVILIRNEKSGISTLEPKPTIFITSLSDYPAEKENTFMLTVKLTNAITGHVNKKVTGSLLIYHRKEPGVERMIPGDILIIKCTPLEIVNRGNPDEFDYKLFMASKGIKYYAFTGKQNIIAHLIPDHRKLAHIALIIREKIIKMYSERGVTPQKLPLVSAITLGQKNLLDPETKQIFINAGIMHIMAVSGLHAVILSLFIFNLLFFLKGKFNIIRIIITLLILWAFAFVTGLTPSVLRATLMFTFLQAGNLMNRKVNGINSVLASAFILIILQPSVITDAGFLLSYSAVIYIIGFYEDFYQKLHFSGWLPDKIWQSVVVTLVAQAGTLPLTIMLFNRFPLYFILTNVIIVPLANLLIIVGCLVPLTYSLVPVSELLAYILDKLTGLIEFLTGSAASLPYATIDRIGMTMIECMILAAAVSLLMIFLLKRRPFSIGIPLIALVAFYVATDTKIFNNGRSNELIVYNNSGLPSIALRTGTHLRLLTPGDTIPAEVLRHASTEGLKIIQTKNKGAVRFIKVENLKLLMTDSLRNSQFTGIDPDILVLTGKRPYIEKFFSAENLPGIIIFSSEIPSGFRLPFTPQQLTNRTIRYIKKSGAYTYRL